MPSNASSTTGTFYETQSSTLGKELQRNLAIQDWIALVLRVYLTKRIFLAPDSPEAELGLGEWVTGR